MIRLSVSIQSFGAIERHSPWNSEPSMWAETPAMLTGSWGCAVAGCVPWLLHAIGQSCCYTSVKLDIII